MFSPRLRVLAYTVLAITAVRVARTGSQTAYIQADLENYEEESVGSTESGSRPAPARGTEVRVLGSQPEQNVAVVEAERGGRRMMVPLSALSETPTGNDGDGIESEPFSPSPAGAHSGGGAGVCGRNLNVTLPSSATEADLRVGPPPVLPGGDRGGTVARGLAFAEEGRSIHRQTEPATDVNVKLLKSVSDISDNARGSELLETATAVRRQVARKALEDDRTLRALYNGNSVDQLAERLGRARADAEKFARDLEDPASSSIDRGEAARFRNFYLNASDKAAVGLQTIEEEKSALAKTMTSVPFLSSPGSGGRAPGAVAAMVKGLFGAEAQDATTNDALVNRLVMMSGLSNKERGLVLKHLKLAEEARLRLANGEAKTIPILHNGYIFGASATSVDCSSFVSSVLPADVRKGRFTTLDFEMMWRYARTGRFPSPPKYEPDRAKMLREVAVSFRPISIYEGEALKTGDLLVYRSFLKNMGHIFIVREFDRQALSAEVIEAAQSAGTIRERRFPLSLEPQGAKRRYLRPGLLALRLKPTNTRACQYDSTGPSSGGNAHGTKGGARM